MTSKEERRFAIIEIDMLDFLGIFKSSGSHNGCRISGDSVSLQTFDLPDDAYADCAEYNLYSNSFYVRIISKEFDRVPLGAKAPTIQPKITSFVVQVRKKVKA